MTKTFKNIRLTRAEVVLLDVACRRLPVDLRDSWRKGQLLWLFERLPIPDERIACPGCGGTGAPRTAAAGCPGDCCQVCPFCRGYRWFPASDLTLGGEGGEWDRTLTVRLTPPGVAAIQTFGNDWNPLGGGELGEHGTAQLALLRQEVDSGKRRLHRVWSERGWTRGHASVPLTIQDLVFLRRAVERLGTDGASLPGCERLRRRLRSAAPASELEAIEGALEAGVRISAQTAR